MLDNTVSSPVVMTLMSGPAAPVPLLAELRFDPTDPYAAHIAFDSGGSQAVTWTFARDLLDVGLVEPVGDGDVSLEPVTDQVGNRSVRLHLRSPQGAAVLDLSADDALGFLEASYAQVAPGRESLHLDLDATVTALLTS